MRGKSNVREQDNVSQSSHVKDPTPRSHLSANHEMFNYCLLTLARIPSPGWRASPGWWRWRGTENPCSLPHLSLFLALCYGSGSPDQELQMISWQFYTLFKPVMFYRLICYDTLLRIQLWIRDVSWGWKPASRWAWPMTWKAIGDASACSMCCADKAAGHRQKPSRTNFADHSVFNRWVSTGADLFFFFLCAPTQGLWISLRESVAWVDT